MSVDIKIYATEDIDKDDFITFEEISRSFCTLIRCVAEEKENCELLQIATIASVDSTLIKTMCTWQIWQKHYGGFPTNEEEQKFIQEYSIACDKSWQGIESVLCFFTALHDTLLNDTFFESRIHYTLEWLSTYAYFKQFDKDILFNNRLMDKNFGWDLRNIIAFLHSAKENNMKFVRFQLD